MPVKFRKVRVADERFETAAVFDANRDGRLDIVSGEWWYEGPEFRKRHRVGEVRAEDEYYDAFATVPLDVNGDGWTDFVTGGWWGGALRWRENPRDPDAEWPEHVIAECENIETARAWDVDGDGELEIVPSTPSGPLVVYKLVIDENGRGTGEFSEHRIFDGPLGHGLGFGDITGNGRGDFVLRRGWLEAPEDPFSGEWVFHPDFDLGSASVPVLVVDVNGDGLNDLIVGQAHRYGLDWWEQVRDAGGGMAWKKHPIDPYCSQYHAMQWADVDGDGESELVTGKRYRAHAGRDPGGGDDIGMYYFKWNGESFSKEIIDHGPPPSSAGCGVQFAVADLRGTGRLDVVAPGKSGLYVLFNEGS